MDNIQLSLLPLLSSALPENVLGQIADATATARESLRSYLEIDTEKDENGVINAASIEKYSAEAHHAIDKSEKEIVAIDCHIKKKCHKKTDLSRQSAKELNLIRYKHLKLNWKESVSRRVDETACVPGVLKHAFGFSEEDLEKNKWYNSATDEVVRIDPQEMIFSDYEVKKKYERSITLTNVSDKIVKFQTSLLGPTNGVFSLKVDSPIVRRLTLSSGMSMKMKLMFEPKDLGDYCGELIVAADRGPRNSMVIRAKRDPPTLISSVVFNPGVKKIPSDAITVDCGIRLLGSKFTTQTFVMNIGSDASYFIMSEISWEMCQIQGVDVEKNRLEVPPFSIQPYSFSLKKGRNIPIEIDYEPDCEGTHTDQFMITCNNLTTRSLDLLGEAILFDPRAICIEANCKDFDVDEPDTYEAVQCLDFGVVRVDGLSERSCQVYSKIPVDLKYRWELNSRNLEGITELKAVSLTITPRQGFICDSSPAVFRFECDMFRFPPGIYKGLLSFIVENIPKMSLANEAAVLKIEEFKDSHVDVVVRQLEVRIEVRELQIVLEPSYFYFHRYINECEKHKIVAKNESPYDVEVRWSIPSSETVAHAILPEITIIDAFSRMTFEYELMPLKECRVRDILRLNSCLENRCFHIIVEGVAENLTSTTPRFLAHDIGPQRMNDVFDFNFQLLNSLGVDWTLFGKEYDFRKKCEIKQRASDINFPALPQCQEIPMTLVPYTASLSTDGLKMTSVGWTNCHDSTFCDTICLIENPNVKLSVTSHDMTLDGGFYQNRLSTFTASLINLNHLNVKFTWSKATGEDAEHTTLTAEPFEGVLNPMEKRIVRIGVKAHRPGLMKDLHAQCIIEHAEGPLNLSITGYAKTVSVEVAYKSLEGEVSFILPSDARKLMVSEDLDIKDERCCVCFIGKFDDFRDPPKSLLAEFQQEKEQELRRSDSTVSETPYKNWPLVGGYYTAEPIKAASLNKLHRNLGSKADSTEWNTCQQLTKTLLKVLGRRAFFFNVDAYRESSQVIRLKNLSPVPTSFSAEVLEFHERVDQNEATQEFENLIQPNAGLLLSLNKKTGSLRAENDTDIILTAYGNCWGIYFDHLSINIPDLDRIVIPIVVVVTGLPVWFTFAPPKLYQAPQPVLRFTAAPPKCKTSQTVYVYNNSFLTLKLAWTTYARRQLTEEEASLDLPYELSCLSLCPEFHPTNDENFLKVHVINYLGDVDSVYFNVEPRVSYIPPKCKSALTITVNTKNLWFDLGHLVHKLVGVARAFVYTVDEENTPIENKYSVYRPVGSDIESLILKLETHVHLSKLHVVNCAKDDFILTLTASQVFLNRSKIYKEWRKYYFLNKGEGPAIVSFSTQGIVHFEKAIVVDRSPETFLSDKNEITVNSGDTIELTVSLIVTEQDVYSRIRSFIKPDCSANDNNKDIIIINQKQILEQEVPIIVQIITPNISVSTRMIDFGMSLVNRSKTKTLRLRIEQGPELFSIKLLTDFMDVFKVAPLRGWLATKTFTNVYIRFTPKECLKYSAKLLVIPCLPTFAEEINLLGRGTWDRHDIRPQVE